VNSLRIQYGDYKTALELRAGFRRLQEERDQLHRQQLDQQRQELENVAADERTRAIKQEATRLGDECRGLLQGQEKQQELDHDGEEGLVFELRCQIQGKEDEISRLDLDCSELCASYEDLSSLAEGLYR